MKPLVLNVDDEPANLHVRRQTLEAAGIDVVDAGTGGEVQRILQVRLPDMVLLDVRLPDASGFDLCRRLKSDPVTAEIYVLLVSAEFRSDEDFAQGLQSGADGYLRTPTDPRILVETVLALLRRQRSERRNRAAWSQAEAAVRRSEQIWRGIFDHAPLGIFHATPDGRITMANSTLALLLGAESPKALVGASIVRQFAITADWSRLIDRLSGVAASHRMDSTWTTITGTAIAVVLRGRRIEGPVPQFEVFVTDVTEQKRLEEEFRQAQKMEAVGRLAGGIAHDFNNLLTAILGYAELALDQARPDSDLACELREIRQAAQRAASLTQQLLAFSRRQVLTLRPVNVSETVLGMRELLRRLIGEDIRTEWIPAPDLPVIEADPAQLEQVIMNLAVNARDAMPSGGTLTVRTAVECLSEGALPGIPVPPGLYVRIDVQDTGEGMDAATQSRIFEPFFTTKIQGKGTGLGLSTVYGIVKQLNGFIQVKSAPAAGATFSLFFPATAAADAESGIAEPQLAAAAPAGGECVLLVEDEEVLRRLTRAVLTRHGYRVIDAGRPLEAIALAEERRGEIALVLSDVMMPEMRGWRMVEQLRDSQPQAKVLYMSGYVDEIETAGELVRPLLAKPFKPRELLEHVRRALDA